MDHIGATPVSRFPVTADAVKTTAKELEAAPAKDGFTKSENVESYQNKLESLVKDARSFQKTEENQGSTVTVKSGKGSGKGSPKPDKPGSGKGSGKGSAR